MSWRLVGGDSSVWERNSLGWYLELGHDTLGSVGDHDDVEAVLGEETRLDSPVFFSGALGVFQRAFESVRSVIFVI